MDPMAEEQLDYGDDEYGGSQKLQYQGSGAISALADEELIGEDDEYDDLYNDVNVGEGFMQSLQQQSETPVSLGSVGNGGAQGPKVDNTGVRVSVPSSQQEVTIPGVGVEGKNSNTSQTTFANVEQKRGPYLLAKSSDDRNDLEMHSETQGNAVGYRGPTPVPPKVGGDPNQIAGKFIGGQSSAQDSGAQSAPPGLVSRVMPPMNRPVVNENINRPPLTSGENGSTMLFVGELHWWTTDAELESVCSQYGRVKEIKFFDERASGKSKGYCQVEFYESTAAAACKEGMNGYMFNGRACVVAFASPQTLKQMGAAYFNKTQAQGPPQGRRTMNDSVGRSNGMNYQGGDGGRNFSKVSWGRGAPGVLNCGQGGNVPMRGRGSVGGRGMVGTAGAVGGAGGGPYGQGLGGPAIGPGGGMMHPQGMMGAGFDPAYMGRGAGYGGFAGPAFPGMMPSFPAVNTMALPGVAPHVNPAFFSRGVSNGMGMMGATGMDAHTGMWTDPSMAGWGGDEHGQRTRESSYGGDDVTSDHGYGEASQERGGRSNASREKDRGCDRDWSGTSERRHRDERDSDLDRSDRERHREEKDRHRDHHRPRDRDWDNDEEWDRSHSSRSRSKSSTAHEDDHRSRTRDSEYVSICAIYGIWLQRKERELKLII
ncbi:hypothetical protein H6P81_011646 [Aristolochia fimbriata]|uniref:RRM domain-containing protein n=1 Tax=Aristolochia fimbriata TaxID=158543 RepID=A0AAV7EE48_ARIFI|nr:hypothetical protein H6P81_011646 [Aristolochia fimbriata]